MTKPDRKADYKKYLESPEWKALSAKARKRDDNKCVFCGGPPENVHHVQYPKSLNDDELSNLVTVCEVCHSKCHGKNINVGCRNDIYATNLNRATQEMAYYVLANYFERSSSVLFNGIEVSDIHHSVIKSMVCIIAGWTKGLKEYGDATDSECYYPTQSERVAVATEISRCLIAIVDYNDK